MYPDGCCAGGVSVGASKRSNKSPPPGAACVTGAGREGEFPGESKPFT